MIEDLFRVLILIVHHPTRVVEVPAHRVVAVRVDHIVAADHLPAQVADHLDHHIIAEHQVAEVRVDHIVVEVLLPVDLLLVPAAEVDAVAAAEVDADKTIQKNYQDK